MSVATCNNHYANVHDTNLICNNRYADVDDTNLTCKNCYAKVDDTNLICNNCYAKVEDTNLLCNNCYANVDDTNVCQHRQLRNDLASCTSERYPDLQTSTGDFHDPSCGDYCHMPMLGSLFQLHRVISRFLIKRW